MGIAFSWARTPRRHPPSPRYLHWVQGWEEGSQRRDEAGETATVQRVAPDPPLPAPWTEDDGHPALGSGPASERHKPLSQDRQDVGHLLDRKSVV